jgi:hypothetical protein
MDCKKMGGARALFARAPPEERPTEVDRGELYEDLSIGITLATPLTPRAA